MLTLRPRTGGAAPVRPETARLRRPRWTHPRALAGATLVVVSMVLGGLLVASVARSTEVWALATDVRAGEPVAADDLVRVDVRLDPDVRGRYLTESDPDLLADRVGDTVWGRDLAAGELVPESALSSAATDPGVELPVAVTSAAMPADLGPGHRVDVWVAQTEHGAQGDAQQILSDVAVVAVHGDRTALGEGTVRSVVVRVADEDASSLGQALAALAAGEATLVRRTGASS